VLAQEKPTGSASGTCVTLRSKYSQIRLTGHDFLSIGTGGVTTTNFPGTPTQAASQGNETEEVFPGRVFYVSTDQDGNFRVGDYVRLVSIYNNRIITISYNNFSCHLVTSLTSVKLPAIKGFTTPLLLVNSSE